MLFADDVLGLGLKQKSSAESAKVRVILARDLPEDVKELVDRREEARSQKQYEEADALRRSLESLGYTVTDTPEGPSVRKK